MANRRLLLHPRPRHSVTGREAAAHLADRSIEYFARWFAVRSFSELAPPKDAVRDYKDKVNGPGAAVRSFVIFRVPPFQVELITIVGAGEFPEHAHPNVESIEIALAGDLGFTLDGRRVVTDARLAKLSRDGSLAMLGEHIKVRAGQSHGAVIGPMGGAFLSIQKWLNGVAPTSVGLDWEGAGPHSLA